MGNVQSLPRDVRDGFRRRITAIRRFRWKPTYPEDKYVSTATVTAASQRQDRYENNNDGEMSVNSSRSNNTTSRRSVRALALANHARQENKFIAQSDIFGSALGATGGREIGGLSTVEINKLSHVSKPNLPPIKTSGSGALHPSSAIFSNERAAVLSGMMSPVAESIGSGSHSQSNRCVLDDEGFQLSGSGNQSTSGKPFSRVSGSSERNSLRSRASSKVPGLEPVVDEPIAEIVVSPTGEVMKQSAAEISKTDETVLTRTSSEGEENNNSSNINNSNNELTLAGVPKESSACRTHSDSNSNSSTPATEASSNARSESSLELPDHDPKAAAPSDGETADVALSGPVAGPVAGIAPGIGMGIGIQIGASAVCGGSASAAPRPQQPLAGGVAFVQMRDTLKMRLPTLNLPSLGLTLDPAPDAPAPVNPAAPSPARVLIDESDFIKVEEDEEEEAEGSAYDDSLLELPGLHVSTRRARDKDRDREDGYSTAPNSFTGSSRANPHPLMRGLTLDLDTGGDPMSSPGDRTHQSNFSSSSDIAPHSTLSKHVSTARIYVGEDGIVSPQPSVRGNSVFGLGVSSDGGETDRFSEKGVTPTAIARATAAGGGGGGFSAEEKLPMRERLIILCKLGAGASSVVYKALDLRDMRIVALKMIHVYDRDKRVQMVRELGALFQLIKENSRRESARLGLPKFKRPEKYIVDFYDAFSNLEDGVVAMMIEYMDGGSLQDIADLGGCDDETTLANISIQALKGLSFLHGNNQIHRDLKPGNFLITHRGEVKVADLGIMKQLIPGVHGGHQCSTSNNNNTNNASSNSGSNILGRGILKKSGTPNNRNSTAHSSGGGSGSSSSGGSSLGGSTSLLRTSTFVGTATYMSPERIDGKEYSFSCDVWAFGLSMITVALGRLPLETKGGYWTVLHSIRDAPSPELPASRYSKECREFLALCMKKHPDERWTCKQLLNHPFLKKARAEDLTYAQSYNRGVGELKSILLALLKHIEQMKFNDYDHRENYRPEDNSRVHGRIFGDIKGNDAAGTFYHVLFGEPDPKRAVPDREAADIGEDAAVASETAASVAVVGAPVIAASSSLGGGLSAGSSLGPRILPPLRLAGSVSSSTRVESPPTQQTTTVSTSLHLPSSSSLPSTAPTAAAVSAPTGDASAVSAAGPKMQAEGEGQAGGEGYAGSSNAKTPSSQNRRSNRRMLRPRLTALAKQLYLPPDRVEAEARACYEEIVRTGTITIRDPSQSRKELLSLLED